MTQQIGQQVGRYCTHARTKTRQGVVQKYPCDPWYPWSGLCATVGVEAWWAVEGQRVCRTHRSRWSPHNSVGTNSTFVQGWCDGDNGECLVGEKRGWYGKGITTYIATLSPCISYLN